MTPVRAVALLLAALASLLLLALLVLPRWIDTPAGRAALVGMLSELAGTPVSVEGAVEFGLLPQPNVTFARLRLAEGRGVFSGTVDRIDAELDPGGLLAGRLVLSRLRVVRPDLVLDGGRQRLFELPSALAALPVASAEVIGGRISVADGEGGPLAFEELDLLLRPGKVEGARKIEARLRFSGERLGLELEVGPRRPGGQTPVDMRLFPRPGDEHGEVVFSGLVGGAGRLSGELRMAVDDVRAATVFAALAGIEGFPPVPLSPDDLPASLELRLQRTEAEFTIEDGRVGLPRGDVRFSGRLVAAEPWDAALDVRIRHWRVDDLPSPAAVDRVLADLPPLRFTGTVDIAAERIEIAGLPVENLRARLRAEGGGFAIEELRAPLPGGGDIRATVLLRPPPAEERARIELGLMLPSLPETLAARGNGAPAPDWLPRTFTADVAARRTRAGWSFDRIDLIADATRASLSGSLRPGARQQLGLGGRVERLDLGTWLPVLVENRAAVAARLGTAPFDLDVDLAVDGVVLGPARAEEADLALQLAEGRLRIDRLQLHNLAGASFEVSGSLDPRTGEFDARVDGAVPAPARLLRLSGLPAGPLVLALGPVETRLQVSGRGDLVAAGLTLGSQHLSLAADFRGRSADVRGLLSADLRLDVPSLGEFARAAGVPPVLPGGAATPFELRATLTRSAPDIVVTAAHGRVADAAFTLDGEWRTPADRLPEWVGRLRLDRPPPRPVVDILYRLAQPLAGFPPDAPWEWPGAWPAAPFPGIGTAALALDLEVLLDAGRGRFRVLSAPGRFALEGLRWPFAEGQLFSELALVGRDGLIAATGRLGFEDVELAALFGGGPPPPVAGRLQLDLEFSGRGRSPAEIVANLAGSGRLAVREGAVPDLRPSSAPLAAATRPRLLFAGLGGEMRLARGQLRPVRGALQLLTDRPLELAVDLDLYAWMIEARLGEREAGTGRLRPLARLFGPLDAPEWSAETRAGPPASVGGPEHPFGPH